jgi:hypothetical protein
MNGSFIPFPLVLYMDPQYFNFLWRCFRGKIFLLTQTKRANQVGAVKVHHSVQKNKCRFGRITRFHLKLTVRTLQLRNQGSIKWCAGKFGKTRFSDNTISNINLSCFANHEWRVLCTFSEISFMYKLYNVFLLCWHQYFNGEKIIISST